MSPPKANSNWESKKTKQTQGNERWDLDKGEWSSANLYVFRSNLILFCFSFRKKQVIAKWLNEDRDKKQRFVPNVNYTHFPRWDSRHFVLGCLFVELTTQTLLNFAKISPYIYYKGYSFSIFNLSVNSELIYLHILFGLFNTHTFHTTITIRINSSEKMATLQKC